MEDTKIRELAVDEETKTRLENAAWLERASLSDLARQVAQAAIDGEADELDIDALLPKGASKSRIGALMNDATWDAFADTAWRLRSSRAKLFRALVASKYAKVPLERKKVMK